VPGRAAGSVETIRSGEPAYDLLFVGRLSEIKQPEQFVRIVHEVSRSVPAVRAAMVGDGPLEARLRRLADELGVADRIDLLGAREDVGPVFERSRIFVLTSRSEGLSIALLEALAAGLPAVVADVGELGEAVEQGKNGWRVTPDAIGEYTDRILSLLRDDGAYASMSAAARDRATALASIEAVCQRWRHALDAMVAALPHAAAGTGRQRELFERNRPQA
jgi:glycosyltransferase involved in cell wall biosynthesis